MSSSQPGAPQTLICGDFFSEGVYRMRCVWNSEEENHRSVLASMVGTADNLSVICPYIRAAQVEDMLSHREFQSLRMITLWDIRTFLTGASEPEALHRLLQHGADVRTMSAGLHAKVYIVDGSAALVTSANLSAGGMINNLECGVALQEREAVAALTERFNLEWRRATPLTEEQVVDVCATLVRERARTNGLFERLKELEQEIAQRTLRVPSVWTPQVDEIAVELTPAQVNFLQRPLRGEGGYQTLLARLQNNLEGHVLRLTRTDCERIVRYATRYGAGGFQTRLLPITQQAALFISN